MAWSWTSPAVPVSHHRIQTLPTVDLAIKRHSTCNSRLLRVPLEEVVVTSRPTRVPRLTLWLGYNSQSRVIPELQLLLTPDLRINSTQGRWLHRPLLSKPLMEASRQVLPFRPRHLPIPDICHPHPVPRQALPLQLQRQIQE